MSGLKAQLIFVEKCCLIDVFAGKDCCLAVHEKEPACVFLFAFFGLGGC